MLPFAVSRGSLLLKRFEASRATMMMATSRSMSMSPIPPQAPTMADGGKIFHGSEEEDENQTSRKTIASLWKYIWPSKWIYTAINLV